MIPFALYADTEEEARLPLTAQEEENGGRPAVRFTLPVAAFQGKKQLSVYADAWDARAGEDGWYLLPQSREMRGSALIYFREREDGELKIAQSMMAMVAARVQGRTYLLEIARNYNYVLCATCRDGQYHLAITVDLAAQPVADDMVLTLFDLGDADMNGVARVEREVRLHRGEIAPLSEKCAARSELDYNRRYPLIRIRMGWKPVPSPVEHQTLETEPPMHVACTFARVRDIADALHESGVVGAELSLVGWNQKGHDGRWPQIFPVEEALGGEEELRRTIAHVQALGYTITCHTNCLDHYEIADNFRREDIAVRADGKLQTGGCWGGGRAHGACPKKQVEQARRDLPAVAALGFHGLHYIDVLSILTPYTCFSPDHPCTMREAIGCMDEIMQTSQELFGGFSSEGGMDFSLGGLDFSLYQSFSTAQAPLKDLIDQYVPLWELTYHGIVLYNPFTNTVNYGLKGPDEAVSVYLYGGRPTFYFYSKFGATNNWMGDIDLTCDGEEDLRRSVSVIRKTQDDYAPFAALQNVYMSSYREQQNGLREIRYENGARVVANYTDAAQVDDATQGQIAPHSYQLFS